MTTYTQADFERLADDIELWSNHPYATDACAKLRAAATLAGEVETSRMQMAACMTATFQNTAESAKERIGKDHPCWTQAYADVCAAVDREIALRDELAALRGRVGVPAEPAMSQTKN